MLKVKIIRRKVNISSICGAQTSVETLNFTPLPAPLLPLFPNHFNLSRQDLLGPRVSQIQPPYTLQISYLNPNPILKEEILQTSSPEGSLDLVLRTLEIPLPPIKLTVRIIPTPECL